MILFFAFTNVSGGGEADDDVLDVEISKTCRTVTKIK